MQWLHLQTLSYRGNYILTLNENFLAWNQFFLINSFKLPAHNPFVPPSAITQVMLIANPQKKPVSLKYVISYVVHGEPQTEMGQVDELPL